MLSTEYSEISQCSATEIADSISLIKCIYFKNSSRNIFRFLAFNFESLDDADKLIGAISLNAVYIRNE